jgi:hypothetical protein
VISARRQKPPRHGAAFAFIQRIIYRERLISRTKQRLRRIC